MPLDINRIDRGDGAAAQPARRLRRAASQAASAPDERIPGLVDPRHLDRLEDLLAAVLRVVLEAGQCQHPLHEVGEAHRLRVDAGTRLGQGDGNFPRIGPLHFLPPPSRS
jgi:hypothetical protein